MFIALGHVDVETLEEDLVQHAADLFGRSPVGISCVPGDLDGHRQIPLVLIKIDAESFKVAAHGGELLVKALLLTAEHLNRDGVVVVSFEELTLLAFGIHLLRGEGIALLVSVLREVLQLALHGALEPVRLCGAECDPVIEVLNELLDAHDLDGA